MTLGLLDSMMATQEFVVPRSMPTMLQKEKTKVVSQQALLGGEHRGHDRGVMEGCTVFT